MGGITYTGGCVVSYLDGGSAEGGFTLRLSAGTHHLDGEEALALSRTRENLLRPAAKPTSSARTPAETAGWT